MVQGIALGSLAELDIRLSFVSVKASVDLQETMQSSRRPGRTLNGDAPQITPRKYKRRKSTQGKAALWAQPTAAASFSCLLRARRLHRTA
jgi:hypothetical protein